MSTPQWAWELARAFWQYTEPTNDLREAIRNAPFDLAILERPQLRLALVQDYLRKAGIRDTGGWEDRPLRACLVAQPSGGLIFLDQDDPGDEQRFSLAHELAHYLRHSWQPQERTKLLLGGATRLTRPTQRLVAFLRGVTPESFAHLMARFPEGMCPDTRRLEQEADTLAVELLAPQERVRELAFDAASAQRVYRTVFGLPETIAALQAQALYPPAPSSPFTDRLRKKVQARRTSDASGEP